MNSPLPGLSEALGEYPDTKYNRVEGKVEVNFVFGYIASCTDGGCQGEAEHVLSMGICHAATSVQHGEATALCHSVI